MSKKAQELLSILKNIQGSSSFTSAEVSEFTPPRLHIDGFGELGFPINDIQAKALIELARQAPFGKGSETVTDTSVRNTWEIDAGLLSFGDSKWPSFIKKSISKIEKDFDIEKKKVKASLYKLLIYEKGGFFKTHKDSEKEPGMFASLIITLPSTYTGGELCVRFGGQEEIFDFSEDAGDFKLPYAAFYADCDHEVKPLTSGCRVCLVYNLIQTKGVQKIAATTIKKDVELMVPILESMKDSFIDKPLAVLLGHQYTPTNFTFDSLKSHDKPRAESLMKAAEKAGYFATLGLVTHYLMGELEGGNYYDRYSRYRRNRHTQEETSMGDVHEMETRIEHWSELRFPSLGEIRLDSINLLADIEIGAGEPIQQEEEGFTGNAGMTMEYWYHYGAIILWPNTQHTDILMATKMPIRLGWMNFYLGEWDNTSLRSPWYVRELLGKFDFENVKTNYRFKQLDFSGLAVAFGKLEDESFLLEKGLSLLTVVFEQIEISAWRLLLQQFNSDNFVVVFQEKANSGDKNILNHFLDILLGLLKTDSDKLVSFVVTQLEQLPNCIDTAKIHELEPDKYSLYDDENIKVEESKVIVMKALQLSQLMKDNKGWGSDMLTVLTKSMPRTYVNEVLIATLFYEIWPTGELVSNLKKESLIDLKNRVDNMPQPPADWRREVPVYQYYEEEWEILRPFLESPTAEVFDYRANQSYRSSMASAIMNETIDLKTETIKKGSPHILRLTKTQAAYDLKLKQWKEDVKLLGEKNINP